MKIEAGVGKEVGISDLVGGTPFWQDGRLYMKVVTNKDQPYNAINLANGILCKWDMSNPTIACVKIVTDESDD